MGLGYETLRGTEHLSVVPTGTAPPPSGGSMTLIDARDDDRATLEAEDAAIRAEGLPTPEVIIPTGETLAALIESLSHAATEEAHDR